MINILVWPLAVIGRLGAVVLDGVAGEEEVADGGGVADHRAVGGEVVRATQGVGDAGTRVAALDGVGAE